MILDFQSKMSSGKSSLGSSEPSYERLFDLDPLFEYRASIKITKFRKLSGFDFILVLSTDKNCFSDSYFPKKSSHSFTPAHSFSSVAITVKRFDLIYQKFVKFDVRITSCEFYALKMIKTRSKSYIKIESSIN